MNLLVIVITQLMAEITEEETNHLFLDLEAELIVQQFM